MALSTAGAVFGVFRILVKDFVIRFVMSKKCPERMYGSSQTYLFIILIRLLWLSGISKNMRFFC